MEWLIIFFGGLLIGLTLGLTGSGGSILTVPVLVYLIGHPEKVAIAESMLIVGAIALVTVIPYAKSGETDWGRVLYFGIPGILGAFLGKVAGDQIDGSILLIIFGGIVLASATLMLMGRTRSLEVEAEERSIESASPNAMSLTAQVSIIGQGLIVGFVTGLVGVGGGFLIVPALVLLGKLSMRRAVGTSLAIICLNAASGFMFQIPRLQKSLRDPDVEITLNSLFATAAIFVLIGIAGSLIGRHLSTKINQQRLRKGFACFLLVMGALILAKEIQQQTTEASTPTLGVTVSTSLQHIATLQQAPTYEAEWCLPSWSTSSVFRLPPIQNGNFLMGSLRLEENSE